MTSLDAIALARKSGKKATAIFNDDSSDLKGTLAKTEALFKNLLNRVDLVTVGAIGEIIGALEKAKAHHELHLEAFDFWKLEHQDLITVLEKSEGFDLSMLGDLVEWNFALDMQKQAEVSLRDVNKYITLLNNVRII
ncbi:hypothetical protein A2572_03765 [Candidatus Collierbacteria bacterium RIFOXYD1_FULL_40_9]|uniref:Uncharacterized protein n=1 Tax=Candidatus Collierbacteria bacterium RIFOXYD1_FULL_40_9 TaxID=1817731 RepID=A0A1F5FU49_9BACT|nr:MAG: hypothetical protein A2572_03765 [Candidatus Collierbacteria bacterium RIFOXYD1_FULL_40_9]